MTEYAIRVDGHLSEGLVSAFSGLVARPCPAQTILVGELPDQSALLGVLLHLDEVGVHLVDVQLLPAGRPADTALRP